MISKEEVQHIAKLVRLRLSEAEIKKYQKQLGEILDYVSQLKKISTKNIMPFSLFGLKNIFRLDKPKEKNQEQTRKLVQSAPAQKEGMIKTKGILNIKALKH
ncbi:MAG: Asp-tRNA(Asn)/Glu-tRNA(Gln) amidotransferase subunit GatC [Patescibacteria group bacterium]|jgi:aspartyl-tRNA(Asn)/glutamyl-tRNA(Gln) amidotransferase subunit C|nr:Asp-tRNA(Asn)/Glu-tRNA(Gln) amidotransferase subunit GatC [Patescibacteria group bacterium]MDD5172829.1 Asp-tRNA(Asn)/Glu-tRNA(Gln) amidotransferase subunit GatC [Patescibacteria group bacterium]